MENKTNIKNSIILIGPCGVGKSLVANTLSQKANKSLIDIDDLIHFTFADYMGDLSQDKDTQQKYIQHKIAMLKTLDREVPLTEEECKREEQLAYEYVDLYNYYYNLLGGFKQFYDDVINYINSDKKCLTRHDQIYYLNKCALQILNKIFASTDNSFIISPPASFGWNTENPIHFKVQFLQNEINKLLGQTNNILLQPGEDYLLRIPTDEQSVNTKLFIRHYDFYYKNADIEISTNGLFNEPENDFLKQRTWLNVRETLTKERLKNQSEIDSICDQILFQFSELDLQK